MKTLRRRLARLRGHFSRSGLEARLKSEIEEHITLQTEENLGKGLSPSEARRQAVLKFGAVEALKEEYREKRGLPFLDTSSRDVRYVIRQFRKSPVFAITAIVTLALGIGANTTIFSVMNAVILRPLPFADPDRLLSVRSLYTRNQPVPDEISYPNFFDFRTYNHVFEHLVCFRDSEFTLSTGGRAIHLDGEIVSWDLFPALGVSPALGRGFVPREEQPNSNAVVLSYDLWQSQFAGDPDILKRSVTIDGKLFAVVGVAPKAFHFPVQSPNIQLWTTIAQDATAPAGFHPLTIQRGARTLDAIGRLKPGVTLEQARAQMDVVGESLARQYPADNKNVAHFSIRPELQELTGNTRQPLLVLMGAVGLLLLIACMNVANLLLSRTAERSREFGLRAAIGASRAVILRQILTEGLTLGVAGSIVGLLLALASIRLLIPLAGTAIPRLENTHVDLIVLTFCVGVSSITAIGSSLAPMAQIAKVELAEFVKEGARGIAGNRDRLRRVLVVAQLTLSLVLLCGASLLTATFVSLETRDPGFKPDHVLKFSVGLPDTQYPVAKQILFDDQLLERLRAIPGVTSAASGWPLPLEGNETDQVAISFDIQERPAPPPERPHADLAIVSPDFFQTLGIPLLRGRVFSQRDDMNAQPVVVVNQAFAERFFPGEDALGKRIRSGASFGGKGTVMQTIVGIVGNAKQWVLAPGAEPIYYFPYKQLPWGFGWMLVRTSVPPLTVERAARSAVASLDSQAPVYKVTTMEDSFSMAIAQPRFHLLLFGSFAGIALLLTMVGLYGLMAYSVTRRTREIGTRIALGANRGTILRMVLQEAGVLLLIGIGLGVSVASFAIRPLERMLYGMHLETWSLLAIACLAMALTGAIATYLPARRAASIDPMQALRLE